MSEQPYMQLWIADYLGDTQHLTIEQSGMYLHLLFAMWRAGGSLPHNEIKLARIVRVPLRKWKNVCSEVMEFFDVADGMLTQKRLSDELQKVKAKCQLRRNAGLAGVAAKALKYKKQASANGQPKVKHLPEPEPLATNVAKREKRAHPLPPDWHPTENHFLEGEELGFSAPEVLEMAEDMRLWAGAKGEVKKNWDMAFSGWMRREKKTPRGHGPPRTPTKEAHFRSVMAEHIEEVDRGNVVGFGRRALRGPDSGSGSGELYAATARHENDGPFANGSLHRNAKGDVAEDG